MQAPAVATGVGEPSVHFYDNKALLTFADGSGEDYTSRRSTGVPGRRRSWLPTSQARTELQYRCRAGALSTSHCRNGIRTELNLYQIENSDTRGPGAY